MKQRANQWGDGRVRGDAQRFPFNHCLFSSLVCFFSYTFFSLSARVVPPPIPLCCAVKRGEEQEERIQKKQADNNTKKKEFLLFSIGCMDGHQLQSSLQHSSKPLFLSPSRRRRRVRDTTTTTPNFTLFRHLVRVLNCISDTAGRWTAEGEEDLNDPLSSS